MEQQVRSSLASYALALCRALAACRELAGVLALLQQAAATLLDQNAAGSVQTAIIGAAPEAEVARSALLAAAAAAPGQPSPAQLLRPLFYASSAFQDLAETLLTVVAPDWLPSFSGGQRQSLFDAWFEAAPAVAVLPALARHLAAVQPSSLPSWSGRAKVTAVSADVAAGMLASRFAAPGSTGVQELVQHVQQAAVDAAAAKAAGAAGGSATDAAAATGAAAGRQEEGLAAALASIPERAAAAEQPQLSPEAYVPFIAQQLLDQVAKQQQEGTPGSQAATAAAAAATAFAADVLARFCRRGYAQHVAAVLLGSSPNLAAEAGAAGATTAAAASSLVAAMPDSVAVDKLVDAAVKEAAAVAAGGAAAANSSEAALPLDASPAADPVAHTTAAALSQLVPPAVWRARADVRLALTDKLLLQLPRRLPPLSALRGLLLYLQQQAELPGSDGAGASSEAGSSGSEAGTSSSLLAGMAARVAQLWGDASAVQRLAPPQQAYLTAALCGGLALLSRKQLDRHPQLLSALLAGITTRLDSPLQAVRRQAMRVGQALSALLDPSKPPMFAEEADQLRQLLPEERWEPQQAQREEQAAGQPAAGTGGGKAAGSQAPAAKLTPREARKEARRQRREAAAARKAAREQARRERDQQEAEGPLTETDSDDEAGSSSGASSISSSGSSDGSSSGGEFEQYDLEESDEEDPAKSKLQLRDLPKMLLSKAEEDWRGQLRALRHAEWLIRAAPDELPQYAVPLARALVHTKVPGWMDEEMPQAAPRSANTQRFRDVVSLLVEAPEPAGLALAAEMYGPSMDVYQRAMILDGMSAAAAEIAKPGSTLPPLPGLHKQTPKQLTAAAAERATAAAAAAAGLTAEQQRLLTTTAHGSKRVGTVTRIASRSLAAAARRQGGAGQATHVNSFPPIALKWAAALLKHCDEPQHGIDLLGKDHFLLGKLLVTLGSFLEASSQSTEAATLAAATLELMRCGRVHNHPEPFVRRAALLAAGQVLGAVPPARLATAMLSSTAGSASPSVALSAAAAARDAADEALVSRLEWLRGWTEQVAEKDPDDSCRMMADGVRKLQGNLAAGALAALGSGQAASPLETGSLLPLGGAGGRGGRGGVSLPVGLPDIRLP